MKTYFIFTFEIADPIGFFSISSTISKTLDGCTVMEDIVITEYYIIVYGRVFILILIYIYF
jgi:hypothetical protein